MTGTSDANSTFHAHLFSRENEIEIKIFYDPKTYFGDKLSSWIFQINSKNFGAFTKVEGETQNEKLQKIDLLNSKVLSFTLGSNQYEGELKFISVFIDSVKFYWNPHNERINTAEFYLNEAGFDIVKRYYSVLFKTDNQFDISRMNELNEFYSIEQAEFRPEFHFLPKDNRDSKEAIIVKEPKIQFKYKTDIQETEAIKYAEIVRLLFSFYHHVHIDYIMAKIHLKEYSIYIKKIPIKEKNKAEHYLWGLGYDFDFDHFMKSNWQQSALQNFKKLSKSIEMFIQSHYVDSNSRFLIRYNIIEVCMSGIKHTDEKFKTIISDVEIKKKYNEALNILLQTINPTEHEEFIKKWDLIPNKLSYKPMKSSLLTFLEKEGFNPLEFPITLDVLKKMRDSITHGSIEKINPNELERANIMLYRISGILILNLMGIKDWSFNKDIPN